MNNRNPRREGSSILSLLLTCAMLAIAPRSSYAQEGINTEAATEPFPGSIARVRPSLPARHIAQHLAGLDAIAVNFPLDRTHVSAKPALRDHDW